MKRVTLVMIMTIRANHLTTILQIVTLIGVIQITQIAEISSNTSASSDKVAQALSILGLDSNATFDDVKRAHKKMMFQYHPDRLAAQNLSPDMVEIYTDTAKSVQAAYDYLKKIYSDYI